jgi:hypothetical protein
MNSEEKAQTFAVGPECVVVIETSSGDAQVAGGPEGRVEVESADGGATVQQEGATLHIATRPGGSGDVHVKAPQHSNIVLRLVSGDAEVGDIAGQVNVQTTSGDVKIKRLRGDLKIHSISGDLEVRQSGLRALSIDTVSGDVEIETTLEAQGEYDVRGVSGDLKLRLPAGQGCTVSSSSLSGDFRSDLPHEIVQQGRGKLEVRINGGGPAFRVRSTSGDISVTASTKLEAETWAQKEDTGEAVRTAPRAQDEMPFAEQVRPGPSAAVRETKPLPTQSVSGAEPFAIKGEETPRVEAQEAPPPQSEVSAASRRMEILKAIEEGRLSVSEGLAKLRSLE